MNLSAILSLVIDSSGAKAGADQFTAAANQASRAGSELSREVDKLKGLLAGLGLAFGAVKAAQWMKETIEMSARYNELGIGLTRVAQNVGVSVSEIRRLEEALKATGISATESRQTMMRMVQANISLADATKLARVAQDAAVVGQTNSSEALHRITQALATGQTMILHHMGIQTNFTRAQKAFADSIHVNVHELTQQQRMQANTNEVMRASIPITGLYEASMTSAAKQLRSSVRYWQDLQVAVGAVFQPEYTKAVFGYVDALKWAVKNAGDLAAAISGLASGAITALIIKLTLSAAAWYMNAAAASTAATAAGVFGSVIYGLMGPVGWFLLAVGALVTGFIAWKKHVENAAVATQKLQEAMHPKQLKSMIAETAGDISALSKQITELKKHSSLTYVDPNNKIAMQEHAAELRRINQLEDELNKLIAIQVQQRTNLFKAQGDLEKKGKRPEEPAKVDSKEIEHAREKVKKLQEAVKEMWFELSDPSPAEKFVHKANKLVETFDEMRKKAQLGTEVTEKYREAMMKFASGEEVFRIQKMREEMEREVDANYRRVAAAKEGEAALARVNKQLEFEAFLLEKGKGLKKADLDLLVGIYHANKDLATSLDQINAARAANEGHTATITALTTEIAQMKAMNEAKKKGAEVAKELALAQQMENEFVEKGVGMNKLQLAMLASLLLAKKKELQISAEIKDTAKEDAALKAEAIRSSMQPYENALKSLQSTVTSFYETLFKGGLSSMKSFASALKDLFVKMVADIAAVMTLKALGITGVLERIQASIKGGNMPTAETIFGKDSKIAKFMSGSFGKGIVGGLIGGIAGGVAGYESGSPLTGALAGAAAGFAVGGPAGAIVAGALGFVSGIFGAAQKAREAFEAFNDARLAWLDSLTKFSQQFKASGTEKELTALGDQFTGLFNAAVKNLKNVKVSIPSIAGPEDAAKNLDGMKQFLKFLESFRQGSTNAAKALRATIGDLEKLTKAYADNSVELKKLLADQLKEAMDGLRIRQLRREGNNEEADHIAFMMTQIKEMDAAIKQFGASSEYVKQLGTLQVLEAQDEVKRAAKKKKDAEDAFKEETRMSLVSSQERILTASGHTWEAQKLRMIETQRKEWLDAVAKGLDFATLAALALAQAAETAAAAAAHARDVQNQGTSAISEEGKVFGYTAEEEFKKQTKNWGFNGMTKDDIVKLYTKWDGKELTEAQKQTNKNIAAWLDMYKKLNPDASEAQASAAQNQASAANGGSTSAQHTITATLTENTALVLIDLHRSEVSILSKIENNTRGGGAAGGGGGLQVHINNTFGAGVGQDVADKIINELERKLDETFGKRLNLGRIYVGSVGR